MKNSLLEMYKLEKRIAFLEKKVFEAKQVGTLYHVCTLEAYLNWIEPKDMLQASGKYYNWVYGDNDYVSFTRDKYFVVGTKSVQNSSVLVQLVIDGDKLSENYKIGPYNDFAFGPNGEHIDDGDTANYREKEEACKGPIKNLSKYIKEIRVDVFNMTSLALSKIRKSKLAEKNVVYFNFIKGYQDKFFTQWMRSQGVKNGTPLADLMPVFKDYVNRDKFNDMLFSYDEDEIKKAIKGKADLNAKYPSGYVFDEYLSDDSNADIVKMLLKAGANPNLNMEDHSPLGLAAEYNSVGLIKLLVSNGADLELADSRGYTPLMIAVKNKSKDAIDALIELGADVNASNDSDTVLSLAKTKQLQSLLKKAGATA